MPIMPPLVPRDYILNSFVFFLPLKDTKEASAIGAMRQYRLVTMSCVSKSARTIPAIPLPPERNSSTTMWIASLALYAASD